MALWLGLIAGPAAAEVPNTTLCIRVNVPGALPAEHEALRLQVEAEVRESGSHVPGTPCAADLSVDIVDLVVLGQRRRGVTAWLSGQRPQRRELALDDSVQAALSAVVAEVLAADPIAVLTDDQALEEALAVGTALPGVMSYGVEVAESTLFVGAAATFSPALALRVRRGLGALHVGGRLRVAFATPAGDNGLAPTVNVALEPEVAWFVWPDASTSLYLAGGLGLTVLRFDGLAPDTGDRSLVDWGVHVAGRVGVEFLRVADFRLDLFAAASLPLFRTDSEVSELVDDWTPTVELGLGVAF